MHSELGYYTCALHCVVAVSHTTDIIAGSLESANSSILAAQRLFKDLVGKNQDFMIIRWPIS